MANQEVKRNLQETCSNLRSVSDYLRGAADNIENHSTRERIEGQLQAVQRCLRECESIEKSM